MVVGYNKLTLKIYTLDLFFVVFPLHCFLLFVSHQRTESLMDRWLKSGRCSKLDANFNIQRTQRIFYRMSLKK